MFIRLFVRNAPVTVKRLAFGGATAVTAATVFAVAECSPMSGGIATLVPGEKSYSYSAHGHAAVDSKAALPKPKVLFVLGGPGAGKGTQCGRLVSDYGFVHLSAGDLLREERDSGSPDGAMITQFINEGKIVPVEVTVSLIRKAMAASGASKFLVDGFPRNFNNLEGWNKVMGDSASVEGVLFYECPEEVMESRLLHRGKSSGRSDDKADVIKKRFNTYVQETMPVIDYFRQRNKVLHVVADRSVDEVYRATQVLVEPIIKQEVLEHTQAILDSIHATNWMAYEAMTSPEITAFEAEEKYALVHGLPIHKYAFDAARAANPSGIPTSSSTVANPTIHMLTPKSAVIAYDRVVSRRVPRGSPKVSTYAETRALRFEGGRWKQLHLHRSAVPAA